MGAIKVFRNAKLLDEEIARLREDGFDSLHLPGGRSKNGKHSAFVAMWFYDDITKDKYLLVVPYKSLFHKTEVNDISNEIETIKETAVREVEEETGIKIHISSLISVKHKGLEGKRYSEHYKYFFVYNDLKENQIPKEFLETSGEISSPFLITKRLVKKRLFRGHHYVL